jgi:transcriptional regulator with XRE-family HTH domain
MSQHWTERSIQDFVHRISFDFVAQVEKALESNDNSQAKLAKNLGVTEGRVSQVLNNPGNLGLKNIVKYARAIGRKVAIVLYDDGDATNNNGPVSSDIFSTCWEQAGRPSDLFSLHSETNRGFVHASYMLTYGGTYYTNFTSGHNSTIPPLAVTLPQGIAPMADQQFGQLHSHSTSESTRLTVQ